MESNQSTAGIIRAKKGRTSSGGQTQRVSSVSIDREVRLDVYCLSAVKRKRDFIVSSQGFDCNNEWDIKVRIQR